MYTYAFFGRTSKRGRSEKRVNFFFVHMNGEKYAPKTICINISAESPLCRSERVSSGVQPDPRCLYSSHRRRHTPISIIIITQFINIFKNEPPPRPAHQNRKIITFLFASIYTDCIGTYIIFRRNRHHCCRVYIYATAVAGLQKLSLKYRQFAHIYNYIIYL